jgi:2-dehydropantoate 2-reductase
MRILVVGAGAIGGYFGARLLKAGRDITFLVRKKRAQQLAIHGLTVRSRFGDLDIQDLPIVLAETLKEPFDLIMLSCKAYDLDGAIASFAPAVGPDTAILPLLNGMRHLEVLDGRFGASRVLGGLCVISATLDEDGRILHVNDLHDLAFGERDGATTARVKKIEAALTGAHFSARLSTRVMQDMWEKWVFIATLAGITCMMRASIGDIAAAGGTELAASLLNECAGIAAQSGFPMPQPFLDRSRAIVTTHGSPLMASMLRDIERGARTEANHILGDLLRRANPADGASLLRAAYVHVKAYEARRLRNSERLT